MPPKSKEPSSPTKKPNAKWNTPETEALISFLHREADRTGATSFKEASFTAAANHIRDLHTEGAVKTAAHCKTKWSSLKARFNTAERLASSSGAGASFNPRTGSNATTTSEQSVIDDFAASNSNFQPGGFQYYDAMTFIVPSTAHGHSSFRGTRSNDAVPAGTVDDNEDIPSNIFTPVGPAAATDIASVFQSSQSSMGADARADACAPLFAPSTSSFTPLSTSSFTPPSTSSFTPPSAAPSVAPSLASIFPSPSASTFVPPLASSFLPLPPSSSPFQLASPSASSFPPPLASSVPPPSSSLPRPSSHPPPQQASMSSHSGRSAGSGSKRKSDNGGSGRASKRSNTNDDITSQNLILLNSFQGSLGTIVDSLRQVGFTPEANIDTAIRIVQSPDSGLSVDDQATLASLFSDSPNKAAVFRALVPGEARNMWIQRELERYHSQ